jgi:hypothetical protein
MAATVILREVNGNGRKWRLIRRKLVIVNGSDFASDFGDLSFKLIMVNGSDFASNSGDLVFHSTKVVGSDSGCSLEGMYVLGGC